MKKSKYNYFISQGDVYYIYNGFSGACVALSAEEYNEFQLLKYSEKNEQEFLRLGLILPDNVDETKRYLAMLETENIHSTRRFYRILTTTDCNARCYYCYEKGIPVQSMDDKKAKDVADFIIRRQRGNKKLFIQFFGGEPLCNIRAIDIISEQLHNIGLSFLSSMTTNGFLINHNIAKKAKNNWNVQRVQITLDGTKNVYEKIKGIDSPNAFERVIENIHSLSSVGIKVSIRLNYSERTKNDILALIDFLSTEYENDKNISVYTYRLFDDKKSIATDEEIYTCLARNGFLREKDKEFPDLVLNPCMARRADSLVILPNGDLAKCSRGLQLKNGIIGSIYQKEELLNGWEELNPVCIKCKHLPLCGGGCKCEEFMQKTFCSINEKEINGKILNLINTKEKNS
ncbi:MAG: radical SAM protein [Clostridiales bacterium]|nr:radical SAM protein [Clostridiales bacterium]